MQKLETFFFANPYAKIDGVWNQIGFDGVFGVDREGMGGGIWRNPFECKVVSLLLKLY